jgi:trafficking protein particle complex subunit 5
MAQPPTIPSYHAPHTSLSSQRTSTASTLQFHSQPALTSPDASSTLPTRPLSSSTYTTTTSQHTLRTPSHRRTIYDRNLNRSSRAELSRASFAYLIAESISYHHKRIKSIADFEARLSQQGYLLGSRCLDLLLYRSTPAGSSSSNTSSSGKDSALAVRPLRILSLLNLLTTKLYPLLFARPADSLEQSTTSKNEYMVIDNTPLTNTYISVPREMSQLSVAAYIAGVLEGVCDAAGFEAKVSAHNQPTEVWPGRTVFLVRFDEAVVGRDGELERGGVK